MQLILLSTVSSQINLTLIVKLDSSNSITSVGFMNAYQTLSAKTNYTDTVRFSLAAKEWADLYTVRFGKKSGKIIWKQLWLNTGDIVIKGRIEKHDFLLDTVMGSRYTIALRIIIQSFRYWDVKRIPL